jgi:hypothetical protein
MINLTKFLGGLAFFGLAGVGCLTLVSNGNFHIALVAAIAIAASFVLDLIGKVKK